MEKTYKVEVNAITGNHGQTFRKGDIAPHSHLINHDNHLSCLHISEVVCEAKDVIAPETKADPKPKAKTANELSDASK